MTRSCDPGSRMRSARWTAWAGGWAASCRGSGWRSAWASPTSSPMPPGGWSSLWATRLALRPAGLAGDDLVQFSTGFVGLASDLALFNNTTPEQAIQAIGAALRGESEPLRAYGVLLDDATMRQKALELGLIETTS